MTDDTLIAQLQARNALLTTERDACRDESRRLATECEYLRGELDRYQGAFLDEHGKAEVNDQESEHWHQECERLRAALEAAQSADATSLGLYQAAHRLLREVKTWRDSDGNEGFPHALRERIDAALAGTPAPRPPRDESVLVADIMHALSATPDDHTLGEVKVIGASGPPRYLSSAVAEWCRTQEHAPSPAPPDHGACEICQANCLHATEPPAVTEDDVAFAEKHGSPVTRSEPTRAEPVLPGLQALQYANEEALRGQVEREIADWLENGAQRCDPSKRSFASRIRWGEYRSGAALNLGIREEHPSGGAEHPVWAASSVAAEDQPQPACPPVKSNWSATWAQRNRKMGAAERPRQEEAISYVAYDGTPTANATSTTPYGDPAPEAQRAQSEARHLHLVWSGTEWVDERCGCRYHPDDDNGSHGGAPHVHRCKAHDQRTPAPNIAAAVAELEEAVELDDWTDVRRGIRRALAHLQVGAK
jgi:hypothetical protein